jgi:hypothetical protein
MTEFLNVVHKIFLNIKKKIFSPSIIEDFKKESNNYFFILIYVL